ncbi:secretoglobin family 3A member 1 [Suricata suricatta]|uniref:secretoglobin family 3A member 1 n=1 Tax=Suricata suricatta TaxID=37032 RepID=UPI001155C0B7|nr:secretoglobin family 3A member 1 [Suricata suricatta]
MNQSEACLCSQSSHCAQSAMKLAAAFLVLCVALLSRPAATFFVDTVAKPVASALTDLNPAVEAGAEALAGAGDLAETAAMAGAGAMANPFLQGFKALKFILTILGFPVKQLMEDSRKPVAELGPEAMGAVKSLLGALTYLG